MENNSNSLHDAIAAVPTFDIVEHFGVPYMERKGRVYLLCPGHNDTHFGSCYIDQKEDDGYYCYACAEHVNKWNMVKKLSGYTNYEIANWFFQKSGITPSNQANPMAPVLKLVKQISRFIDDSTVYNDIYACEKKESSYGRIESGEYLYSEPAIAKPIIELYKADYMLFVDVVTAALEKKKKQYENVVIFCDSQTDNDKKAVINKVLVENPHYTEMKNACQRTIAEISDLILQVKNLI